MGIFDSDPLRLAVFADATAPPTSECWDLLDIQARLVERYRSGSTEKLTETRVEQSFNERIFAEMFGYRTLLRHGTGEYELLPKWHYPKTGRFDDFALGFFGADDVKGEPIVSCELKSPGADLDAPQKDRDGKLSPVQQSARAPEESTVKWIIVSNMQEMRLYRAGDTTAHESVHLENLLTPTDLRRALALFSKATLLGSRGQTSPLLRLLDGEEVVLAPRSKERIRLVHHFVPVERRNLRFPFYKLDDAAVRTLDERDRDRGARVSGETLVYATPGANGPARHLEVTKSGIVRISEYVDKDDGPERVLEVTHLARRLILGLETANDIYRSIGGVGDVEASWHLENIGGARAAVEKGWGPDSPVTLKAPQTSTEARFDRGPLKSVSSGASYSKFAGLVVEAIRELLFLFTSSGLPDRPQGRVVRVRPEVPLVLKACGEKANQAVKLG